MGELSKPKIDKESGYIRFFDDPVDELDEGFEEMLDQLEETISKLGGNYNQRELGIMQLMFNSIVPHLNMYTLYNLLVSGDREDKYKIKDLMQSALEKFNDIKRNEKV